MDAQTETPAASPDLSLDDIIAQHTSAAESSGASVVKDDSPKGDSTQGASEADGAHTADPAGSTPAPATGDTAAEPASGEPKADEITAARARKILERAEELQAKFDARDRELTQREQAGMQNMLAELLKAPKAFLAKHGKHIDDLIDASVSEGTVEAPAKDDNPRLTALEKRLEEKERAEVQARNQALFDQKKAQVEREVKDNAKLTAINAAGRQTDVTDYMVEYYQTHGKPIEASRAAFLVEQDLKRTAETVAKALGWTPPAAAKPAETPKDRPGTTSIGGAQTTGARSPESDLPEDPEDLLRFLTANPDRVLKTA